MDQDLDLLQGTWTVTALEMDGEEMPAEMLDNARVTIEADHFSSTGMGPDYKGTLRLDAAATPRKFDLHFDEGPEKGNTNRGIYEINGDTLKLCLATRGKARPSSFATKPGSGFALEILKHGVVKPKGRSSRKRDSDDAAGPATEFEGEWRMVSAVMDGQAMDPSAVQWVKRVTRGNVTTIYAGPQVMLRFEFTHGDGRIDYVIKAGANKGKRQQGIYKFEGGRVTVCMAAPGASRPIEFESGRGFTFTVWERVG